MRDSRLIRWLAIPLIGGTLGALGDFAHFARGIDGYPPGGWRIPSLGLPIWVPPLFATATVAIAAAHAFARALRRRARARTQNPAAQDPTAAGTAPRPSSPWLRGPRAEQLPRRWLVLSAAPFLALYLLSAFIPPNTGAAKDLLLSTGAAALWWALDRSAAGAVLALLTALTGTVAEGLLVSLGVFFYLPSSAAIAGVPSWLPWLYAGASSAVACLVVWAERSA